MFQLKIQCQNFQSLQNCRRMWALKSVSVNACIRDRHTVTSVQRCTLRSVDTRSGKITANRHAQSGSRLRLPPIASHWTPIGAEHSRAPWFWVSLTTDHPLSDHDSVADTRIISLHKLGQRCPRRTTPVGRDTQLRREHAPETARARVRCLHVPQATFLPR
jgi:hypothetical protein